MSHVCWSRRLFGVRTGPFKEFEPLPPHNCFRRLTCGNVADWVSLGLAWAHFGHNWMRPPLGAEPGFSARSTVPQLAPEVPGIADCVGIVTDEAAFFHFPIASADRAIAGGEVSPATPSVPTSMCMAAATPAGQPAVVDGLPSGRSSPNWSEAGPSCPQDQSAASASCWKDRVAARSNATPTASISSSKRSA